MELEVPGAVEPTPEPLPCPPQAELLDGSPGHSGTAGDGDGHGKDTAAPATEREDKKQGSASRTNGSPAHARWSSSQPHQAGAPVRAYHSSKARVTMTPGFTSHGNSNQQGAAWGTYTFPRPGLHYQHPHASYAYCHGQPAVSPRLHPSLATPCCPGILSMWSR
ncbi:hypothetical protein SKAU_G00218590 [Synaphobranchus kaupii]|uniref:Uncharacterized protein n=1 Tax=Synaphobranchus kaupii TaxID=118154 RepID=A0A9Q1FAK4_SYNKA|nr:hypothetical protein SKAU_G00218590 [Synaphobranchus kaupii]